MRRLANIKWLPVLMVLTIAAIAAFQFYWLQKAFEREERGLERQTNMLFRETIGALQASKLKLDRIADSAKVSRIILRPDGQTGAVRVHAADQKMVAMMNAMVQKAKDSGRRFKRDSLRNAFIVTNSEGIDTMRGAKAASGRRERLMQFLFDVDYLQDSIRVKDLSTAYRKRLDEQNLDLAFRISRVPTRETPEPVFNEVTLGFNNPITYHLDLASTTPFLLRRISAPILFSIFLVAFTLLSFTLLYRNLLKQQRLADIKNEFISNITHELKTPIATVSVAIEALRSFNAGMSPERTKEYLDISANELQRLSLLVDKVLKLSMFEKREIDLRYEALDMRELVDEVTSSMRLQFEGDRLHLVSVIFNLIDNAIKYSAGAPEIQIRIGGTNDKLTLSVSDAGIGIPAAYQGKVFEKFFRVPTGNLHNAKGYGLGLSYVAHVVSRHQGAINVESSEGNGSRFLIQLPRHQAE